jgi:hypothetical protein
LVLLSPGYVINRRGVMIGGVWHILSLKKWMVWLTFKMDDVKQAGKEEKDLDISEYWRIAAALQNGLLIVLYTSFRLAYNCLYEREVVYGTL